MTTVQIIAPAGATVNVHIASKVATVERAVVALAGASRYILSADGKTVYDTLTRLTWQQAGSDTKLDGVGEEAYITKLNSERFGGINTWRAPDDIELSNLTDRNRHNPAIDPVFACKSDFYRTGKETSSSSVFVWFVGFDYGYVGYNLRASKAFCRAVSGPSPAGQ